MKVVTFKTISQEMFELSIDENQTILDVKNAIENSRGKDVCPVERQKLIYAGKILNDNETFDSLNYDVKKFIVVVLNAKKKAEVDSSMPAILESTESKASSSTATSGPTNVESTSKASAGAPELSTALLTQPVEYLINGIPETLSNNSSTEEIAENVGLEFLQNNAAFGQIRQMVQSNPEMLSEVIQNIASLNPALMSVIKENERAFLELLNSDAQAAASGPVNPQQQEGDIEGQGDFIEVTAEERDAINRIKDMGFPEQLVVEAYIACDKNEELAIEYIIARMNEF
uniref:UV excision repair protein RAD23 n=1 Tax=Panagrolaimus superbus TaxID=310955 RepID=A0A914Z4Q3_9BILA